MRYAATTAAPRVGVSWVAALYLIAGGDRRRDAPLLVAPALAQGMGLRAPRDRALAADPAGRQPARSLTVTPCF